MDWQSDMEKATDSATTSFRGEEIQRNNCSVNNRNENNCQRDKKRKHNEIASKRNKKALSRDNSAPLASSPSSRPALKRARVSLLTQEDDRNNVESHHDDCSEDNQADMRPSPTNNHDSLFSVASSTSSVVEFWGGNNSSNLSGNILSLQDDADLVSMIDDDHSIFEKSSIVVAIPSTPFNTRTVSQNSTDYHSNILGTIREHHCQRSGVDLLQIGNNHRMEEMEGDDSTFSFELIGTGSNIDSDDKDLSDSIGSICESELIELKANEEYCNSSSSSSSHCSDGSIATKCYFPLVNTNDNCYPDNSMLLANAEIIIPNYSCGNEMSQNQHCHNQSWNLKPNIKCEEDEEESDLLECIGTEISCSEKKTKLHLYSKRARRLFIIFIVGLASGLSCINNISNLYKKDFATTATTMIANINDNRAVLLNNDNINTQEFVNKQEQQQNMHPLSGMHDISAPGINQSSELTKKLKTILQTRHQRNQELLRQHEDWLLIMLGNTTGVVRDVPLWLMHKASLIVNQNEYWLNKAKTEPFFNHTALIFSNFVASHFLLVVRQFQSWNVQILACAGFSNDGNKNSPGVSCFDLVYNTLGKNIYVAKNKSKNSIMPSVQRILNSYTSYLASIPGVVSLFVKQLKMIILSHMEVIQPNITPTYDLHPLTKFGQQQQIDTEKQFQIQFYESRLHSQTEDIEKLKLELRFTKLQEQHNFHSFLNVQNYQKRQYILQMHQLQSNIDDLQEILRHQSQLSSQAINAVAMMGIQQKEQYLEESHEYFMEILKIKEKEAIEAIQSVAAMAAATNLQREKDKTACITTGVTETNNIH